MGMNFASSLRMNPNGGETQMRIKSPVGEYDYKVTAMRLGREGLEVDGSLGQWQTTMVVEPNELAKAAAILLSVALVLRRRR
jgi:hypothetical protein